METEILKYGWLIILTLSQVILFWVKNSGKKNNKKEEKEIKDNPGNYEGRISSLETAQEKLEENNDKDHELIRKDIRKIFNLLNGVRHPGK